jgi:4-amino-4-deoxy-L-arabinose transferase-like glycosyltransferase
MYIHLAMWRSTVSEAWGLPTNQEDPTRTLLTDSMNSVAIREPMRKSLPVRRLQIWGPEERDGQARVIGQRNRPLPYTGPDTTDQLTALKYLNYVAAEQESAVDVDFVARRWLLFVVLALQAALSARLIWANTAFQDEGLYLWAGHLEWAHWLHGTQIPDYAGYFSGAPVLYPPLGALANHFGGLAGARLLSLAFMLLATILLHGITRRLFNRAAANFAASLFAVLAATEFLGAFATYDAMALTLMALSAWLAVVSVGRGSIVRTSLLLLSGVVYALADATKYATALWTPIVVGLVVLLVWRRSGRGAGIVAGIIFTVSAALSIAIGLHLGGASYWQGIKFTTLSRQQGSASPFDVLYTSLGWVAVVLILAVMGAIMISSRKRGWHETAIALLFVVACILAPLEQARIGTFTSLFKHVGYGGWFGCAVAGLALAAFIQSVPAAKAGRAIAASLAIAVLAMGSGILLAGSHFQGWPTATSVVSYLKPVAGNGKILAEDDPVLEYYLPGVRWRDWQAINVNDDVSVFRGQILTGQYAAVVFDYVDTTPLDLKLRQLLAQSGHYKLARSFDVPQRLGRYTQYSVWTRIPEGSI